MGSAFDRRSFENVMGQRQASEARIDAVLASGRHAGQPHERQLVFRVHPDTGMPTEGYLNWGLIPHGARERPSIRPLQARAETLVDKPIFADAFRKRRCVVPMNSYAQKAPRGRTHTIGLIDGEVFGVAGIWENWRDPKTGEWERTFATITVEANALIAPLNDRMPAILAPEEIARWLGPEESPSDLLKPYPAELMAIAGRSRRFR